MKMMEHVDASRTDKQSIERNDYTGNTRKKSSSPK
jgi:hypothetical protein